jgi:hypothetical protein
MKPMRTYSNTGPGVKSMKCLSCDIPFQTTKERRLCALCLARIERTHENQDVVQGKRYGDMGIWEKK